MSVLVGNPFFLGAGASAGAAYEIERSLRFNSSDSAYLSRQFTSGSTTTSFTFSFWMKRGTVASVNQTIFDSGNGTSFGDLIRFNGETLDLYFVTPDAVYASVPVLRDPSAWYHIVIALGRPGTLLKTWINGVESYSTDATGITSRFGSANTHNIGCRGGSGTRSTFSDIYLADIHFVNGQALDPSSFAETNATTGQWAPKEYTGTYGTNGYHLPFSDNSTNAALGTDTSGNGNTWTVNNITAVSPSLSSPSNNNTPVYQVTIGPTNPTSGAEVWSNAFDADTNTYGLIGPITFTGTKPTWSTSQGVELMAAGNGITASVNGGTQISLTNNAFVTISSGSSGTLNSIWIYSSTGASYIRSVRVDGVDISVQALVGTGAEQDSLVDTPTSYGDDTGAGGEVRGNYCTLNPLDLSANISLTNGNLNAAVASGTSSKNIRSTIFPTSGKWYWEMTNGTVSTFNMIGIASRAVSLTSGAALNQTGGYSYGSDGNFYITSTIDGTPATFTSGDVIGCAWDVSAGTLQFYKNGVSQGTISSIPSGEYSPAFTVTSGSDSLSVNFGQRSWAYAAPAGFKALCDTNLPAPVVAKPNTVMDVKLYTGNGSTQTISGLGFSPDLVWGKVRSTTGDHHIVDSVRGDASGTTNKTLFPNTTDSEYSSLNRLYDFSSTGFTAGGVMNTNAATYVAWTWDAGSSTVTNTQGSITSQVRANASAGFSIVTWTGNGTIGHGLNVAPVLYIWKKRNTTSDWGVNFTFLDGSLDYMWLNLTNAKGDASQAAPTSTVITIPSGDFTGSDTGVLYAFSPVAGYSSFGSYTGNGSTSGDGPFVFCNFRPRWIMVKCSTDGTSASDWFIYDSVRDTYNATVNQLYPNRSVAESAVSTHAFDILSNGFKVRSTSTSTLSNGSGQTYIYAAFAESPFQYSRAR